MEQNIFLFETTTEKTTLHKDHNGFFTSPTPQLSSTINSIVKGYFMYVVCDDEIKEGDYCLFLDSLGSIFCNAPMKYLGIEHGHHLNKGLRKIIFTNDNILIENGVKALYNDFLDWYSINPFDRVELERKSFKSPFGSDLILYSLIYGKTPIVYSEIEMLAMLKDFNETALHFIKQDDRQIMTSTSLKKWFELNKKK